MGDVMKERLQKHFLFIILIIVLLFSVSLIYVVYDSFRLYGKPEIVYPADFDKKGIEYDHKIVTVGFWKLPGSLERFGDKYGGKVYQVTEENIHLQSIEYETYNQTDFINRASKDTLVKYIHPIGIGHLTPMNVTTGLPASYIQLVDNRTTDSSNLSKILPEFREVIIVYFKEMPLSIDEFAAFYGIEPIFVKEDIKMAAFETSTDFFVGETSSKTTNAIVKTANDSRVESVKKDTYMFVNKSRNVQTKPEIVYPEDLEKKGIEYVPNLVTVGFWKLPASLEEFGEKNGGKVYQLTEENLHLQCIGYQTNDMNDFIDKVSKDPSVSYAHPNGIGHLTPMNATIGLPANDSPL